MKKWFLIVSIFLTSSLLYWNCSSEVENSFSLRNMAAGTIYVNFRGDIITVTSGETKTLKAVSKGTYIYATTYSVPAGALGSSTSGDVSGSIDITASSKILVLYSSTFINGNYILYATISTSEDLNQSNEPSGP